MFVCLPEKYIEVLFAIITIQLNLKGAMFLQKHCVNFIVHWLPLWVRIDGVMLHFALWRHQGREHKNETSEMQIDKNFLSNKGMPKMCE